MFTLICVWINGWVNNRKAGDLRRYRAHYDVTVMSWIRKICQRRELWFLWIVINGENNSMVLKINSVLLMIYSMQIFTCCLFVNKQCLVFPSFSLFFFAIKDMKKKRYIFPRLNPCVLENNSIPEPRRNLIDSYIPRITYERLAIGPLLCNISGATHSVGNTLVPVGYESNLHNCGYIPLAVTISRKGRKKGCREGSLL